MGVTLTHPTLIGSMCVLLQPRPCCLAPRSPYFPPRTPPQPLAFQAAVPQPFGVQLPWKPLEAPSNWHPHPRGPGVGGMWVISITLPWSGVLLAAVAPPGFRSPFFPTQKPPGLPWGP